MSNSATKQVSFPVLGILGLIFVTLKLGGWGVVATWSWLWVLSPFWIPIVFVIALVGIAAIAVYFGNK